MSALLKIDQAGLPAGVAGKARTDGLATGALVTLTNTGTGTTRFQLLWVPPGDTTAVASLAPTVPGSKIWTFTPTANKPGTYRIELIQNEGQPSEVRERRVLRVRTPVRGLPIPALNELGDPAGSLVNAGTGPIEAAEDNSNDSPIVALNTLRYAAWWRCLHELATALDGLAFTSSTVSNLSGVAGATVTDALNALAPATGSSNGFASKNTYDFSNAPTFNTAADIPAGSEFSCALYGPSGGSGAGARGANVTAQGGGASGAGGCKRWRMTRAQFIAMLPVTLTLPDGGAGGTLASGTTSATGGDGVAASGPAIFSGTGALLGLGSGGLAATIVAFAGGAGAGGIAPAATAHGGGGGGAGLWSSGASAASGTSAAVGGNPQSSTGIGGQSTTLSDNYSFGGGGGALGNSGGGGISGGCSTWGGGGGGADPSASTGDARAGGSSTWASGGGGGGAGCLTTQARNGGAGGKVGDISTGLVAGGGGAGGVAGGAINGVAGQAASEHLGATGSGGGASAFGTGVQTGGNGAAGAAGGGGAGGGGACCSTNGGNMVPGQGAKGGKALFILVGR